ncbi:transmembrane protein 272-like [Clupea harengus]|uniref:Transmembrane protein 272-like n=1 Tax=Clupea harengus TaxID=7950 RepID=A0A6P8FYV7_CLUHA|nr:transmembrane protein 272-like [Clupea harengus]XP_031428382.1 transmembrane protein 272-like [Clupea harengus]XP_042564520.1 transmembrane protein 272-like [Clupea harengus]
MFLLVSSGLGMAFAITEIVIGSVYLQACPIQMYIPIYLVVLGVLILSLALQSSWASVKKPEDEDEDEDEGQTAKCSLICTAWNSLVSLFLFCWFIAGNVWIYPIYQPNYNSSAGPHCDKTLYLFAFCTTTLSSILIGGSFVVGCFVLICSCWSGFALANNMEMSSGGGSTEV